MDPLIENLKSTTFFGKRLTRRQIADIQETVGLFLEHAAMLGKTVERILAGIAACRQRQRPNRSFPRLSRKPASKWRSSKATATATTA